MALLSRMELCGGERWGHRFTCRTPGCPRCRDQYIAGQRRRAIQRFGTATNAELAMVTVVLGAVLDIRDVASVMAKARRDMRNLVNSMRSESVMWGRFEALFYLETDAFDATDFLRLGEDKQCQISEFGVVYANTSGPIWVPTLHGIVRLCEGVDIASVRRAFEHKWRGHRRVDVATFHAGRSVKDNIGGIVNYALKHECSTTLISPVSGYLTSFEWQPTWIETYYSWLYEWSRGFQSLRMTVGPTKSKIKSNVTTDSCENVSVRNQSPVIDEHSDLQSHHIWMEPMPSMYGFSVFDRDLY